MSDRKLFIIGLSSPSDVPEERKYLEHVVSELNGTVALLCGIRIELRKFETHSLPGLNGHGPQGQIDQTLRYDECDLLIGIFWSRFGSPVYDANSGTEHEIRSAVALWEKKKTPQVMLYFRTDPISPRNKEDLEQYSKVLSFKDEFAKKGLYQTYSGASMFEALARSDIAKYIISQRPQHSSEERARCSTLLDHFRATGVIDVEFCTSGRGRRIEAFQSLRSQATSSMLIMGIGMTNLSSQDLPELAKALDKKLSIRLLMLSPCVFDQGTTQGISTLSFACSPDAFDRYFHRHNYNREVDQSLKRLTKFINDRLPTAPGAIELRVYDELIPVNLTAIDEMSKRGARGAIFESCIPYSNTRIHCHLNAKARDGIHKAYLDNIEDLWSRSKPVAKHTGAVRAKKPNA